MNIKQPFGEFQEIVIAATGATALTIENDAAVLTATTITGNITVPVTAGANLEDGAKILFLVLTNGTESITFSGDIATPVIIGVAGKTFSQSFFYNKNANTFYPNGLAVQVD
jgi:hypothetical protein